MLSAKELKRRLRAIAAEAYAVPEDEGEREALLRAMLAEIGNPDPELRDDLIYMTLGTWCYEGRLAPGRRRDLLQSLLDDQHLFYRLGEQGTDSVLTRSFSVLLIPAILAGHLEEPFLTEAEIAQVKERLLAYARREQDHRGYLPESGWAHAVAHTADALGQLGLVPTVGHEALLEILDAIFLLASSSRESFAHDEDGRLAVATTELLARDVLTPAELASRLRRFPAVVEADAEFLGAFHRRLNVRHFLMSLYFRLRRPEVRDRRPLELLVTVSAEIEAVLAQMTP